jgi:hypothetical protein
MRGRNRRSVVGIAATYTSLSDVIAHLDATSIIRFVTSFGFLLVSEYANPAVVRM